MKKYAIWLPVVGCFVADEEDIMYFAYEWLLYQIGCCVLVFNLGFGF